MNSGLRNFLILWLIFVGVMLLKIYMPVIQDFIGQKIISESKLSSQSDVVLLEMNVGSQQRSLYFSAGSFCALTSPKHRHR